jgi:hypothetical protein
MNTTTVRRLRKTLIALVCLGALGPVAWCNDFSVEPMAAVGNGGQPNTPVPATTDLAGKEGRVL